MFTIDALASLTTGESLLFAPTPLDVHKFLLHAYPWSCNFLHSFVLPHVRMHRRDKVIGYVCHLHKITGSGDLGI